jgi:hypothetical protein
VVVHHGGGAGAQTASCQHADHQQRDEVRERLLGGFGLRAEGLGCMVLGFGFWGLRFGVWVQGLRFRAEG